MLQTPLTGSDDTTQAIDPALVADVLRRGPGRPPGGGKTPGSGRAPGTKNHRTIEVEAIMRPLLPKARRTLRRLLESEDFQVALKAASLILAYVYGRPIERAEIAGVPGQPIEVAVEDFSPAITTARRIAFILAKGLAHTAELEAKAIGVSRPPETPEPEPSTPAAPEPTPEPPAPDTAAEAEVQRVPDAVLLARLMALGEASTAYQAERDAVDDGVVVQFPFPVEHNQ